jgi:integrase
VRVTEAGGRAFVLDYRTNASKRHRLTLGEWNGAAFTVADARAKAGVLSAQIDKGGDPMQSAADALVTHAGRPTVAMLADRWMRQHVKMECRPKTQDAYAWVLAKQVLSTLGSKAVADVTTSDILDLVNAVRVKYPVSSNRLRSVLSSMFNHGLVIGMCAANPVTRAVKRVREEPVERHLSDEEFTRLSAALDQCRDRDSADAVRLMYWTGARKSETLMATWDEIDFELAEWTKPSHHVKQKRMHVVPLHHQAMLVLADMKSRARPGETRLFPRARSLKNTWYKLMRAAQIEHFRIHDVRHDLASRLVAQDVPVTEIGVLLGHTQIATTQRYVHHRTDKVRASLNRLPSPPAPVALPAPEEVAA